ncbi:MAG: transglycosylase SLT domain-containing protein [Granulosicoccus sp.]
MLCALTIGHDSAAYAQSLDATREPNNPVPRVLALPLMGNAVETDQLLVREITDEYIHALEPATTTAPAMMTSPASSPSVAEIPQFGALQTPVPVEDTAPDNSVWSKIRHSGQLPVRDNELVRQYTEQFRRDAHWTSKVLHRGKPYIGHVVSELQSRFLPIELALLPAIESGYQPRARSQVEAAGIWQIVPLTAREIGLEHTIWFDGRADIVTSTTAAIDYLSYLNAEFDGDWELTLAAYNAGLGRVRSAIRKNKKANKAHDFWSLDLPNETQHYVPKLLALIELVKDTENNVLDMPPLDSVSAFEAVNIGFRISLNKAASIAGLPEKQLRQLNPGLTHGVTSPDGPHRLYMPLGIADTFLERLAASDMSEMFSVPRIHEVSAGETLSGIALLYGITQKRLRDMNGLVDSGIQTGQNLAVVDTRSIASNAIDYVVISGDTLSSIARQFSVRLGDISQPNGNPLSSDVIYPGEILTITILDTSRG